MEISNPYQSLVNDENTPDPAFLLNFLSKCSVESYQTLSSYCTQRYVFILP